MFNDILSNPLYSGDIGMNCLNRTLPPFMPSGMYYPGMIGPMRQVNMYGNPPADEFVNTTQKAKDKKAWKFLLTIGTGIALTVGALKLGKSGFTKIYDKISKLFSKK